MLDFSIVVLEGAYGSGVAVTQDILAAAALLAPRVGAPVPRWKLFSVNGGAVALQQGLTVQTARWPRRAKSDDSVWIIPGLGLEHADKLLERLRHDDARQVVRRAKRHLASGGRVAASCSSVFLLQAADVLAQRRVTTTWWLAPLLQSMAADCIVDADRMVCTDGPITTAGAAFAQTDLMLQLLRERCGAALVDAVSRVLLIDAREAQAPFVAHALLASGDQLVARLTRRVEAALPNAPGVSELAREFCMSPRTLSRQIRKATGKSTLALIQSIRLRRARALLESSRMSVERVAQAVGYRDTTALRRLMRRVAGTNPIQYRQARAAG